MTSQTVNVEYEIQIRDARGKTPGPWMTHHKGHNLVLNTFINNLQNGAATDQASQPLGRTISLGTGTGPTEQAILTNVNLPVVISTNSNGNLQVVFNAQMSIGTNSGNRITIQGIDSNSNPYKIQAWVQSAVGTMWTCEVENTVGNIVSDTLTSCNVRLFFTNRTSLSSFNVSSSTSGGLGDNTSEFQGSPHFRIMHRSVKIFPIETVNKIYTEAGWNGPWGSSLIGIVLFPIPVQVLSGFQIQIIVDFFFNYRQTGNVAVPNFNPQVDMSGTFKVVCNTADPITSLVSTLGTTNGWSLISATTNSLNQHCLFYSNDLGNPAPFSAPSVNTSYVFNQVITAANYINNSGWRDFTCTIPSNIHNNQIVRGIGLRRDSAQALLVFNTPIVKATNFVMSATVRRRVVPSLLT